MKENQIMVNSRLPYAFLTTELVYDNMLFENSGNKQG